MNGSLLVYLLVVTTIIVVPGPDFALVLRATTIGGSRAGFRVIQGIFGAVLIHASLAVFGISTLIAASPVALDVVRIVGAGWLAWIGASAIVTAGGSGSTGAPVGTRTPTRRTGFTTNLLNAKVLLFFVTLLPQFVADGPNFTAVAAALAAIEIVLAMIWLACCVILVSRLSAMLAPGSRSRSLVEVGTGVILVLAAVDLTWIALA